MLDFKGAAILRFMHQCKPFMSLVHACSNINTLRIAYVTITIILAKIPQTPGYATV